ncbi:hypothetical protein KFE98_15355 [bacterium SCSIO 12741]|nr:hypothetical protein KFE98_15355 [bacterium SCSIO 12741]
MILGRKKWSLVYFLVAALLVLGCNRQRDGWTIDALVPLVHSNLNLENIFADSLLVPGTDNVLHVVYEDTITTFKVDDDLDFPDTTVTQVNRGPAVTINWDKTVPLISDTSDNSFRIDVMDLTTARIKSGSIDFNVISSITEETEVTFIMPSAQKGGQFLSVKTIIPASPSLTNPTVVSVNIDLSGYEMDLTGVDKKDYNTIFSYFVVEFTDPLNPSTTYPYGPSDYVNFEIGFRDIVPDYGKGYFFTQVVSEASSTDQRLDLFDRITSGTMDLEEVNLNFTLINEVGADITARVNSLTGINSKTNESVDLQGDLIGTSLNINRAREDYSIPFPHTVATRYEYNMNTSNSNVDKMIESFLDSIAYDIEFTINPRGNISGSNDYIFAGTGITAMLDADIPLCLIANELALVDTADFMPGDRDDNLNNIVGGYLNVHCYNRYPFDAKLQMTLIDASGRKLIDLLEEGAKIEGAVPDANGRTTAPIHSLIKAPATPEAIDAFFRAERAIIRLTLDTKSGDQHAKIYADYDCEVKVVGDFKYNTSLR